MYQNYNFVLYNYIVVYIQGFSEALNEEKGVNLPLLSGVNISHLLWADNLIILALDPESLQKLINVLLKYCIVWGLTVNISKTAIMVFNKSGRILKESHQFNYGDQIILSTNEYCYLGITFTLTG